jgi:hypothetical protein
MQIAGPAPLYIFPGQETRFGDQVPDRTKKISIKMRNVVKEMGKHMPEGLMRHHILLPALVAVAALYFRTAIEAILLLSLWYMRHPVFFLKISTKKYKKPFFFVTVQLRYLWPFKNIPVA